MSLPAPSSPAFHVMAKPIGPICNLDWKYCFYLEKEKLYPDKHTEIIMYCGGGFRSALTADAAHGLTIGYHRPGQLGADRVATAIGAQVLYPKRHVVVVDCGTATTVTALRSDGTLLGGAILPGLSLWPETLALRTAQLPRIQLRRPRARTIRTAPSPSTRGRCIRRAS